MKIKFTVGVISILIIIIFFFPVTTVNTISGEGEILSKEKEKIGNCTLSIEIREVKSRMFCYNRQFSFALDGNDFLRPMHKTHHDVWDTFCSITQMYYDEKTHGMNVCNLVYPNDMSFAVIRFDDKFYFIDNGANIPYSAIPVS